MIDQHGEEWLPVAEAARLVRVRPSAIRVWACRGKVRGHRLGRIAYVNMSDVQHAEHAWTARLARRAGVK